MIGYTDVVDIDGGCWCRSPVLPEVGFTTLFRGNDIANGLQDRPRAVKGLNRVNGSIARVCEGAVFGPAVLELPERPGPDRCRRRRHVLDFHLLVLRFSHA